MSTTRKTMTPRVPKVAKPSLPKAPKAKKGKGGTTIADPDASKAGDKPKTMKAVAEAVEKGESVTLKDLVGIARKEFQKDYDTSIWIPNMSRDMVLRVLTTGVDSLDVALGTGGWVYGRQFMLHGDFSCGKTTLAMLACIQAQKAGGFAMYADAEHKLDLRWFKKLGGDPEALYLYWPETIEQHFEMTERMVMSVRGVLGPDKPIVGVLDSLQILQSSRRNDAGWSDAQRSPESLAYSDCLKKFMHVMGYQPIILYIDQVRKEQGGSTYLPPRDKFGVGNSVGHDCVCILDMDKDFSKEATMLYKNGGLQTKCNIPKNQLGGIPNIDTTWGIVYGYGIDVPGSVLIAAEAVGLAAKFTGEGGGWRVIMIGDEPFKVQGINGIRKLAIDHPEKFAQLRAEIRACIGKPVEDLVAAGEPTVKE